MTYHYKEFPADGSDNALIILHVTGTADIEAFKELVRRGSNLAPDLPASMKELSDLVKHGKILQNYREQNVDQQRKRDYITGAELENQIGIWRLEPAGDAPLAKFVGLTAEQVAAVDDTAGIRKVP